MLAALAGVGAAGALGAARVAGVRRPVDLSDAEWGRGAYDRGRTGSARERDAPGPGLTRRWATELPDGVNDPSPVVVDERVHVVVGTQPAAPNGPRPVRFVGLDAASGAVEVDSVVARYDGSDTTGSLAWDSLVCHEGTFYLLAFDGVHALAPDGTERWHRPLGGGPANTIQSTGHPVVVEDTVYAPTASTTRHTDAREGVAALAADTGELRWRYDVPAAELGWTFPPAYADGTLYCSLLQYGVVALDAATGGVQWETRLPAEGPATVGEGGVFVSVEKRDGDPSGIVALEPGTGDVAWRTRGDGTWPGRSVAAADGRIFHREGLKDLVCREAASGDERWRYEAAQTGLGTPAVADGAVHVLSQPDSDGPTGLLAVDAESGERTGFARTEHETGGDASVALGGGLAFAVSSPGVIQCFESCLAGVDGHCLH
jgi:outer membrane protein assembly factor BamB